MAAEESRRFEPSSSSVASASSAAEKSEREKLNGAQFLAFIEEGMNRTRRRRTTTKKKRRVGEGRKRGRDVGSLLGVCSMAKDSQ